MSGEILGFLSSFGVLAVVTLVLIVSSVRIASEHKRYVVFRLGRFIDVLGPGLFFVIPIVDRAVVVDLRERVGKLDGEIAQAKDRQQVSLDVIWRYQVRDAAQSVLQVVDVDEAVRSMAVSAAQSVLEGFERDDALFYREQVKTALHAHLQKEAETVGVKVIGVEIRNVRRV